MSFPAQELPMEIPAFPLQVLYDGACSICAAEMGIYMRKAHEGRLRFVDLSSPDFDPAPYRIAREALMYEMHAIDSQGRVYRGVEAFWAIWQAFPASTWYGLLGTLITLPGVNLLARLAYSGFARIRKYLPKRSCEDGACQLKAHHPQAKK
jgi:predicted DCC family thiol-disulfide oxidoreductase YuxK